jgi:hypothetical protein
VADGCQLRAVRINRKDNAIRKGERQLFVERIILLVIMVYAIDHPRRRRQHGRFVVRIL